MNPHRLFPMLFLMCILLGACVSKGRYMELETDYNLTRLRADHIEFKLREIQARYDKLNFDNSSLVTRFHECMNESLLLSVKYDQLNDQLEKEQSLRRIYDMQMSHSNQTRKQIEAYIQEQIDIGQFNNEGDKKILKVIKMEE